MATHPHDVGRAPPLRRALALIPSLPRPMLKRFVERAIERLDRLDGDPDLEETDAEDSFVLSWSARGDTGPGCPVSDPGEAEPDREDEHDAEIDTWSHPKDHPAELFIGRRWQS